MRKRAHPLRGGVENPGPDGGGGKGPIATRSLPSLWNRSRTRGRAGRDHGRGRPRGPRRADDGPRSGWRAVREYLKAYEDGPGKIARRLRLFPPASRPSATSPSSCSTGRTPRRRRRAHTSNPYERGTAYGVCPPPVTLIPDRGRKLGLRGGGRGDAYFGGRRGRYL